MTGSLKYTLTAFILVAALILTSCKKEHADSNTSVATDYFTAENESDKIIDAVNSIAYDTKIADNAGLPGDTNNILPSCSALQVGIVNRVITITISFDTTGCACTGWDGRTRSGNIIATWTGNYHDVGSVITITTQNYFVNGVKYDYTETITNKGLNTAGNLLYNVNVSSAVLTFSDSTKINWTSTRTREWVAGANTPNTLDDEFSTTGSSQGIDRAGTPFTATITSPLVVKVGCGWVEKGILSITPTGFTTRTLDFGDGTCDSQATVTIDGIPYNLAL
jgi:hypothetical protein